MNEIEEALSIRCEESGEDLNSILFFLDGIRDSGITNMFGAAPYIQDVYDIDRKLSRDLLGFWMNTFGDRHPG